MQMLQTHQLEVVTSFGIVAPISIQLFPGRKGRQKVFNSVPIYFYSENPG